MLDFIFNHPFIMAIGMTLILEYFVYVIFFRKNYLKLLFYVLLINAISWPIANLLLELPMLFLIVEILVVLIEFPLIKGLTESIWKKALVISIIANILTSIAGVFLNLNPFF